jgi:hypothetical protein
VIRPEPITLEGHGLRLEPLTPEHRDDLAVVASDGRLWELWFTSVPEPGRVDAYIASALEGQAKGHMLPWVVRELESGVIAGTTRYHDIVREIDRVEIGWTFYGMRWQRTHVNTACKLLLFEHAFDTLGRSTRSGARSSVCGPTPSTSRRSARSSVSAPSATVCCATTRLGATARCAIRSCTACSSPSGPM